MQTITYAESADPAVVGRVEVELAKLKPACMRCRRNLTKKDLKAGRVCSDRSACTVRTILLAGRPIPRQFRPGAR